MALQNLRSSTANKRPVATSLSDGQIALNINAASPGIFFKNSSNVLTKVGPIHIGTSAPNSSPAGSSGNAVGEQWMDTSGSAVVMKVWDGSAWQEQNKFGAVAGTAAAPSIYFAGDTDTGIYSPGADQLALATNGTGALFINSSGRIGIGGATAAAPVQINSSNFNIYMLLDDGTNGRLSIQADTNKTTLASFTTGAVAFEDIELRAAQHIFSRSGSIESARIDSSGRLLCGTSSLLDTFFGTAADKLAIGGGAAPQIIGCYSANQFGPRLDLVKSRSSSVNGKTIVQANDGLGEIYFGGTDGTNAIPAARISGQVDGTPGANDMPGRLVFSTTADGASSPTERMRISSNGVININATGNPWQATGNNPKVQIEAGRISAANYQASSFSANRTDTNGSVFDFYREAVFVGSISVTTTATAYNTSSDYRLKENVTPVTDGITRLQQLKPSRFNFIADPTKTVDGFLAHEVQPIVPEAITGEKDAVDDEGNPVYQGIDQSKLVPLLTAALQEAIGEIESLKARVAALESA